MDRRPSDTQLTACLLEVVEGYDSAAAEQVADDLRAGATPTFDRIAADIGAPAADLIAAFQREVRRKHGDVLIPASVN
jgi:hypothetical protein